MPAVLFKVTIGQCKEVQGSQCMSVLWAPHLVFRFPKSYNGAMQTSRKPGNLGGDLREIRGGIKRVIDFSFLFTNVLPRPLNFFVI